MKLRSFAVLVSLALLGLFLPAAPAHSATTQTGTYYPLATARILDTRSGNGAPTGPLGAAATLQLTVGGRGGVPTTGVSAVVINLTVAGATGSSYLTVYPSGQTRPTSSAINYRKGITRANSVTVPLGSGGKIAIYNGAGSVSVIADVLGFYASDDTNLGTLGEGDEFSALTPQRLIDTRTDPDGPLDGTGGVNILTLDVDFGSNGEQSASVKAVAVNVTEVGAGASGYFTVYDGVGDPPATSTLNFPDGSAIANLAIVRTSLCSDCGGTNPPVEFAVANKSSKPAHVIVDLVGVYYNDGTTGLRFTPRAPLRISDSRTPRNGAPFTAQGTQTLTAPTTVAGANTVALVSNLTAVAPSASTFLTVWSADDPRPPVSNLNTPAGVTAANGAIIPITSLRTFKLFNNAGKTNFLIDVAGRFDASGSGLQQQRFGPTKLRVSADSTSSHRSTTAAR